MSDLPPLPYDAWAEMMLAYARAAIAADRTKRGEPVAWMFTVIDSVQRSITQFAAIDWSPSPEDPRELLRREPLYAAPQRAPDGGLTPEQRAEINLLVSEEGNELPVGDWVRRADSLLLELAAAPKEKDKP
jgi:hypothetical protein